MLTIPDSLTDFAVPWLYTSRIEFLHCPEDLGRFPLLVVPLHDFHPASPGESRLQVGDDEPFVCRAPRLQILTLILVVFLLNP